jgi:hypothetical protein
VSTLHQHLSALVETKFVPLRNEAIRSEERIDIPLPDLRDIDWGQEGDEHLRGIALLRALRQ